MEWRCVSTIQAIITSRYDFLHVVILLGRWSNFLVSHLSSTAVRLLQKSQPSVSIGTVACLETLVFFLQQLILSPNNEEKNAFFAWQQLKTDADAPWWHDLFFIIHRRRAGDNFYQGVVIISARSTVDRSLIMQAGSPWQCHKGRKLTS